MSLSANIILSAMRAVKKTGIIKGPDMDADAIENSYTRDGSGGKMHMHREPGMMHCYASAPVFMESRRDFSRQIALLQQV